MPAGGRDPAALPSALGAVAVLYGTGGAADNTGAGGATPGVGRARAGSHAARAGLPRAGAHVVLARRAGLSPGATRPRHRALRPPAAPRSPALWRARPGVVLPKLCGLDPLGAGLSGPGFAPGARGTAASPGAGASVYPHMGLGLGGLGPSVSPRGAGHASAGRGRYVHSKRARICTNAGAREDPAGLGAGG